MARLTNQQKEILIEFAKEQCEKMFPTQAIKKMESEVAEALREVYEKKYPSKDMAVLRKYHCTKEIQVFSLRHERYSSTDYKLNMKFPVSMPNEVEYPDRIVIPSLPSELQTKVREMIKAHDYRSSNVKMKTENYRKLINSSNNIKQVVEVWSEAEPFIQKFENTRSTALCVINEAIISEIRQDVLARKAIQ